jgi:predicted Zn-dependent protease
MADRLAAGRPVMTKDEIVSLGRKIIQMSTFDNLTINIVHTARVVTRIGNDRVISSDDGETLWLEFGMGQFPTVVQFRTNQLSEATLIDGVRQCEAFMRQMPWLAKETWVKHEARIQESTPPVHLWHEPTIDAMRNTRETITSELLDRVNGAGLEASGFVGLMARAQALLFKQEGVFFSSEETDGEVTVTARTRDGSRSGWGGQTARNWTGMKPDRVAQQAIAMATTAGTPVAVEPGRRTAILAPSASVHIFRHLATEFNANWTDSGWTALSKGAFPKRGNKLRQRIFDPRITMSSDPADPEGGYRPYFDTIHGCVNPPMTWVKDGILVNMAYDALYGLDRGKLRADEPHSLRLSGGTTTIEQMIASCKEGIFVNRVSDVSMVDMKSGLVTGVTRDGCFLVKDGKITKAVKNFRFLESPFFFLNKIEALGKPERAAFGYVKRAEWPLPPIIAPPMMVNDFNFSALADFV